MANLFLFRNRYGFGNCNSIRNRNPHLSLRLVTFSLKSNDSKERALSCVVQYLKSYAFTKRLHGKRSFHSGGIIFLTERLFEFRLARSRSGKSISEGFTLSLFLPLSFLLLPPPPSLSSSLSFSVFPSSFYSGVFPLVDPSSAFAIRIHEFTYLLEDP